MEMRQSKSEKIPVGAFLANSKLVRKHSNYLIAGFQAYIKKEGIPYHQTFGEWEKLYKKFITS